MNVQLRWLLISCIHKIKMLQLLLVPEAPPSTMQDTSQLLLSHWPAFCSSVKSLLTALGFCFRPQSGPVAFFFFFLIFLHLVALGLSCGLWALQLQHAGSGSLTRRQTWPLALGVWSLSHWTTREVPLWPFLFLFLSEMLVLNGSSRHQWFVPHLASCFFVFLRWCNIFLFLLPQFLSVFICRESKTMPLWPILLSKVPPVKYCCPKDKLQESNQALKCNHQFIEIWSQRNMSNQTLQGLLWWSSGQNSILPVQGPRFDP